MSRYLIPFFGCKRHHNIIIDTGYCDSVCWCNIDCYKYVILMLTCVLCVSLRTRCQNINTRFISWPLSTAVLYLWTIHENTFFMNSVKGFQWRVTAHHANTDTILCDSRATIYILEELCNLARRSKTLPPSPNFFKRRRSGYKSSNILQNILLLIYTLIGDRSWGDTQVLL